MKSTSGRVQQETRSIFKKHPNLNRNNVGAKIAQNLNVLKKYRNMVDYDSKTPKNIKHAFNRCHMKSKEIFDLLNELN